MKSVARAFDGRRWCWMIPVLGLLIAVGGWGGCAAHRPSSSGPYTVLTADARDPQRARDLHARATAIWLKDPERAESLLREALAADLYHGPSHNNLGILLMQRGELYAAANEFEWARRLMPGHPDPRVNLALVLEHAGQTDLALASYENALEVFPQYLPALQGRAKILLARDGTSADVAEDLRTIALRGDEQWREWATIWLTKVE